jgi:hypothetical protein
LFHTEQFRFSAGQNDELFMATPVVFDRCSRFQRFIRRHEKENFLVHQ